ncbi:MAG: 16S rRNA (cytosine(1402)-N(4))-methyltransferase RsmH [Alcanivorax sp.]|uniref:Ribosomal RNA small subunit methyltransferase H n=1 Tax=Alloalcanivorax marinus TaxID=1177169 RepID=A0A9Q3YN09_9GAMM|nr:16S rRNA (cytosine(1402)-N(4))-methyltransferase RsmH [Alloalcanivorax marinus]MBM7332361.1 16S rRNA (cytosine(1402)-N(4))-methyltransferase RsmH [Alloalcanivorax marinus]MCC4308161.1 16S rRNA (cytosine(1402)-N(4))-methyltransferase RsmH [Alloalcanivorax marinus]MCU5786182.1 methyltransferase [Alloalcanivorax marinus]
MSDDNKQYEHQPVMLEEVLEMWPTRADGFYVDGTFGRGGHSRALLARLDAAARLVGVDRDPQAVATGERLAAEDGRFRIHRARFDCLPELVAAEGRAIDGLLLDLGVSSPQLDDASRGFSFLRDGPLDMRMDPEHGESVADWLARADEKAIADVLYQYGEERKSRRIARRICERREQQPLRTTGELAALIESALGRGEPGKHPATRSFQALRIHINGELDALRNVLDQALETLAIGGRLAIISFHSLEDRLVKRFIRDHSGLAPKGRGGLPMMDEPPERLRPLGKALRAGEAEVRVNARSRSAVLRVAEKVA